MNRPTDVRRKYTFKKCIKRYKLYNNIYFCGGLYDKAHIHRYAKTGLHADIDCWKPVLSSRDKRSTCAATEQLNDYYTEYAN